jgi:hypothetical protein
MKIESALLSPRETKRVSSMTNQPAFEPQDNDLVDRDAGLVSKCGGSCSSSSQHIYGLEAFDQRLRPGL